MFPFKKQIQIACDTAKGAAARLSGKEVPVFEDTETTFAELEKRVEATIAFLKTVDETTFVGAAERKVTLPYFPGKYLTAFDYVREYALPNFFFHVTIAYAIARKSGVALGKDDYMAGLPLQDIL